MKLFSKLVNTYNRREMENLWFTHIFKDDSDLYKIAALVEDKKKDQVAIIKEAIKRMNFSGNPSDYEGLAHEVTARMIDTVKEIVIERIAKMDHPMDKQLGFLMLVLDESNKVSFKNPYKIRATLREMMFSPAEIPFTDMARMKPEELANLMVQYVDNHGHDGPLETTWRDRADEPDQPRNSCIAPGIQ
jgi:hypothetical protein